MSPRKSDSRERMLRSTMSLLRIHGATATTIDQVVSHSDTPRGSVYYHFPRGRTQLVEEAVELGGDLMTGMIRALAEAGDPVQAVDDFFSHWMEQVRSSDYRSGCPIVAVAVEANDSAPHLAQAAGEVFSRWQREFADLFMRHGLTEEKSLRLATLIVAAEEGAVVMCRAQRDTAPMELAAAEIHSHVVRAFAEDGES